MKLAPREVVQSLITLGFDKEQAHEAMSQIGKFRLGTLHRQVHIDDIAGIIFRAISSLDYKSITLKISKHGDGETYDGHVDIEVKEVED